MKDRNDEFIDSFYGTGSPRPLRLDCGKPYSEFKEIKDYLHLYIGGEIGIEDSVGAFHIYKSVGLRPKFDEYKKENVVQVLIEPIQNADDPLYEPVCSTWEWPHKIKLILRPLSDMTQVEADCMWELLGWNDKIKGTARIGDIISEFFEIELDGGHLGNSNWGYLIKILPYLLKQGFDLFGLIEAGLAIDKTKIQTL